MHVVIVRHCSHALQSKVPVKILTEQRHHGKVDEGQVPVAFHGAGYLGQQHLFGEIWCH